MVSLQRQKFPAKKHVLLLSVVFLAAVCLSHAHAREGAVGRIINVQGDVSVARPPANTWDAASPGAFIMPMESVRTGPDGWAAILLADETLIQVNRNSLFVLKEVAPKAGWHKLHPIVSAAAVSSRSAYRLETGEIWLRNKNPGVLIDIETPTVTAGLRGTELNLLVEGDTTSILTVLEGTVGASNAYGSLEVLAGEQAVAQPGMAPRKQVLLTPEDAVQWTISIPSFVGPRDIPIITNDRAFLVSEHERLTGTTSGGADASVQIRLAQVERDLGMTEEAASRFAQVLSTMPGDSQAMTGLGWTFIDRNQPEKALEWFKRVATPDPMTYLGLSVAYAETGAPENAAAALAKGGSLYPEFLPFRVQEAFLKFSTRELSQAKAILSRLAADHPDYAVAWSLLSIVSLSVGDTANALQAADRGVQLSPNSTTSLMVQSYAYQGNFDLGQAEESLNKVLKLDDKNVLALVNLARLQLGGDYIDKAWQTILRAEALAPDHAEVQNLKGFLLLTKRKGDQAIGAFRKAIKADPSLGEPHLGISLAAMRKGDEATGAQEMSAAVLLEPRRSIFLSYWAKMLYELGRETQEWKRFNQALDTLSLAARLDPQDPTPYLYRGIILHDLNRPTEAIEAINKAIALNDNKAVYCSRFLLDRDMAVKNVTLSIIYNQLGLSAWGANKALASVKEDYANFAGHIFLAGAYFQEEGFARVASSEALLGRILQQANLNTFSTWNTFTSFFDKPDVNAIATATAGNFETVNGEFLTYGGLPQFNASFSGSFNYADTDGWRGTNGETSIGGGGIFKWDPTLRDSLTFSSSYLDSEQRDRNERRFEISSPSDLFDRTQSQSQRYELGYHHHFAPSHDFLVNLTYVDFAGKTRVHESSPVGNIGEISLFLDDFDRSHYWRSYYQAQAQYNGQWKNHQVILGTVHFWGQNQVDQVTEFFLKIQDELGEYFYPLSTSRNFNDMDNTLHSVYAKHIWHLTPSLILDTAAYVDSMKQSNAFTGLESNFLDFNPQAGLIWTPTKRDTFRLAAFRTRLPFISNRLDSLDVAGVPIFRNTLEGARADEIGFVWEHEWKTGFLYTNAFYLERDFSFKQEQIDGNVEEVTLSGQARGFRAGINQLVWKGMGLAVDYQFQDVTEPNAPLSDRRDHRIKGGLRFVHPGGFSAFLTETFRYEDFKYDRPSETIWITDVGLGYELPMKRGSVNFVIGNVFDEKFDWVTDMFTFSGRVPGREYALSLSFNFD